MQKRWFFDIYIQGSKKIQLFRAESEIESGWRVRSPAKRVSVIKRISGPAQVGLEQIDQATKSASWMPWCQ